MSNSEAHLKFFENLLSPNKEIRDNAEKDLKNLKTQPINNMIEVFSNGMSSSNENIFQLSTLLLKKTFFEDENIKKLLTDDDKKNLMNLIKSKINLNLNWKSLQRLGECLASLYQITSLQEGFKEILNMLNNTESISRKFAMYIIEVLCDLEALNEKILDNNSIENFINIFNSTLEDKDIEVKVSALKSLVNFLNNLKDENVISKFSLLNEKMLSALIQVLKYENENKIEDNKNGKIVLEALIGIIDSHPKFWKNKEDLILNIVCEISRGKIFKNDIRESALEMAFALIKNNPSKMKKCQNLKDKFIPMLFELLCEVDNINEEDKWEKQKEEDENDKEEMFYAMRDSFDRLSIDLDGKYFMEITKDYLFKYLNSSNWIELNGGFTALAYMCEGCKEIFKNSIQELLNYISKGLTDTNRRVRYSTLLAFGSLVKETSPLIQNTYTNNILPVLAQLMSSKEPSDRVKCQSCNALGEFLKGLINNEENNSSEKLISPYANDLVTLLSELFEYSLKINHSSLQESSLTCISLLSNLLDKNFSPYYNKLMPGLKKLYYNFDAKTNEQKTLKSNCIETIAYLCSSISENRDNYLNDLNEICTSFIQNLNKYNEEDPQLATTLNSFTHLSLSLKEKFLPYCEQILPILKKYLVADIGLKLEDAQIDELIQYDEEEEINNSNKIGAVVLNVGTKKTKLSLHTFALQNKILSLSVLYEISINLGKDFKKYNELMLNDIKSLLLFPYSRKIRKISLKFLTNIMNSFEDFQDKKRIFNLIENDILNVVKTNIKKKFLKEIKSNLKFLTNFTDSIKDKNIYDENFIKEIYTDLKDITNLLDKTKEDIINKYKSSKEEDEEDLNDYEIEFDNICEISRRIMEINGILFKLFQNVLTALVSENLLQSFLNSWKNNLNRNILNSDQEILSAICFIDDYIEYSDPIALKMIYGMFLDNTLNFKTENEDIIQSICYGLGLICSRIDKNDLKQNGDSNKIINYIANVIQREVNDSNKSTYDNALGAMGKYLYYQCDNDDNTNNLIKKFINNLPLKNDLEESKAVCNELFKNIKNNNPVLMRDDNVNDLKDALVRIKDLNNENHFLEEVEIILRENLSKFGL